MPDDYLKYGSKGPRVKALQHLINNNPFRQARKPLVEDGEFGPLTAGAVAGCKYWLGYAKPDIEPVAGQLLIDLLSEERPLPEDYRARRKARQQKVADNQAAQTAVDKMRLRALDIIKGEIGTREAPNHSNNVPYNTWWGWGNVAYCVIGVSWAWVKAGSTAFKRGSYWANTDAMLADAKAGNHGLHLTSDPDPGCPGVIDFDGHSDSDHAITFVKDNGDGTAQTLEFNSTQNGVEGVWNQTRPLRNCWFFEVER